MINTTEQNKKKIKKILKSCNNYLVSEYNIVRKKKKGNDNMRTENNYQKSTLNFRQFLTLCLHDVYDNQKVNVKRETIQYSLHDDNDYSTIVEYMTFEMSDNRRFEIYYQHKGQKYFNELLTLDELRQIGE